jgi:murein DD-endopeptidase MepM/ murein hydrolase activator NlpD
MIDNQQLYSFDEAENQARNLENENEFEASSEPIIPMKLISHIITSVFCLLIILMVCQTNTSWAKWIRTKFHVAINASAPNTFGYISNTEFIKNVVKNGSNLIRLEEVTGISEQKYHSLGQTSTNALISSIWPVQGTIRQQFGWQEDPVTHIRQFYPGIEYTIEPNADIVAISDGRVTSIVVNSQTGGIVVIDHGNDWRSRYCFLTKIRVQTGQSIKTGSIIGQAFDNKMAFEITHHHQPVDPFTVISN